MDIYKNIFNVKMSYIVIFASLVIWTSFAYYTMNELISTQKVYGKIINISGKQRMLSQKTTLIAKRYYETKDKKLKNHLEELMTLMKSDHKYIVSNLTSDNMEKIYFNNPHNIDEKVNIYFKLLDSFYINTNLESLKKIEKYSFELLPRLNSAVYAFEDENNKNTIELESREQLIFIGTIITLILEAFLIMMPALRIIRESQDKLKNFNLKLKDEVKVKTREIEKEHKLQKVYLDSLNSLVVVLDTKGNVMLINRTGCDVLEFSENDILGKNWFEIGVLPENIKEDVQKYFQNIISGNEDLVTDCFENQLVSKNNETKLFTWSNRLLKENGNVIGIISAGIDITKEKNQEKIITEQAKLAAMGEMIGNIAHQWRQPLNVISVAATGIILEKEYNTLNDYKLIESCKMIDENAQFLSQTIDDFRDFIKGDTKPVKFDIKNDTDKFLKLVNSSIKNYYLNIILDLQEHVEINGYPNELIQCFINIFNNAKDELKKRDEED
ncbi:MAG: PAS domain S-box protein, partial [Campylobacterota bacterium]|nr:PAS domain S-box protein [Campylobacterota bacterium]